MYDSVNAHNLPLGEDYYAGYVAGNWPNFIQISKMFPKKRVVSIAEQSYKIFSTSSYITLQLVSTTL
jgi:hypothetical protein